MLRAPIGNTSLINLIDLYARVYNPSLRGGFFGIVDILRFVIRV